MIKNSQITLLILLIIQVSFIPVSQALAAQHGHTSSGLLSTELAVVIGMTDKYIAADVVQSNNETAHDKFLKKTQCAKEYSHKGRCGSCLCISISVAPTLPFSLAEYTPTENYLERRYPLHSIFITPPFRPPILFNRNTMA